MLRIPFIHPLLCAIPCMVIVSCSTMLTLDEPVPAIMNVNRHSTLAIVYDNHEGRNIAHGITSHLAPGNFAGLPDDFYRILSLSPKESPAPSVADADVLVVLSKSAESCSTNYETVETCDHHGKTVSERRVASGESVSSTTCRFSTRHPAYSIERDYGVRYSASSPELASFISTIELSEKIARDIVPHQRTYTVTIESDSENPTLEQAAEACKAGNWTLGEQLAKQAAAKKPQSAEALFLLGIIERHKKNFSYSSELIAKADALQSNEKYEKELLRNASIPGNIKKIQRQLKTNR